MIIEDSHSHSQIPQSPCSLVFSIQKIKNQKKWTREEDELLIQLAEKYSEKNWKEISKKFIKKNSLQCFSRYKRIRPGIIKGSWKKDEDIRITDLVSVYGKAWSKISKILGTRNGKQIRDRFINVLDPEIRKGKFTEEEDNTLILLYHKHGPKWAAIAKFYPNRTADMVKNRFHSSIKKRLGLGLPLVNHSDYHQMQSHKLTSTTITTATHIEKQALEIQDNKSSLHSFCFLEAKTGVCSRPEQQGDNDKKNFDLFAVDCYENNRLDAYGYDIGFEKEEDDLYSLTNNNNNNPFDLINMNDEPLQLNRDDNGEWNYDYFITN